MNLVEKWWPKAPEQAEWSEKLDQFYANSSQYHEMTSAGRALEQPQVQLLMAFLDQDQSYAEVGCGGGLVCSSVSTIARVQGFDVSPIAIDHARQLYGSPRAHFEVARAEELPLADESVDGVYSFEVLEHLWDPVAAIEEMVRIVKPGGFVFFSAPNHLSLDLQVDKHVAARLAELMCASIRFLLDKVNGRSFLNVIPDLDGPSIYPDCDKVSSLIPYNLPKLVEQLGCSLQFIDTFYLCSHVPENTAGLSLQRNTARPFVKWFGDHILLLAIKTTSNRSHDEGT